VNAVHALHCAAGWRGRLWFNAFRNEVFLRGVPPWSKTPVDAPWSDYFDNMTACWLQAHDINVSPETAGRAVQTVAQDFPYHPVLNYLDRCRWDGTPRLDRWAIDYLGAEDTDYVRAVASRWMLAAVARVHEPGCKADCALVLEGRQGSLKSTALRILGQPWFTDDLAQFGTKDAALQLRGAWIIELAELESISRAEVSKIKAFVSQPNDRFRPPYGRNVIELRRQCVFAGTVNHTEYLRDETGGRRFWPIASNKIDTDGLATARDQLWAEAVVRYQNAEKWWLDSDQLNHVAEDEQIDRLQHDAWEEPISRFITNRATVGVGEILHDVLRIPLNEWTQIDQNRVARILRLFKSERRQIRIPGTPERRRVYINPQRC